MGVAAAPFVAALLVVFWPLIAMALPLVGTLVLGFFLLSLIPMS